MRAQAKLAKKWKDGMPRRALDIVVNGQVPPGTRFVNLEADLSTPTAKEF